MSESRGARSPAARGIELPREAPEADDEILRSAEAGDVRGALARCARLYGASIGRLCMAMLGSQVDADDVTQETLLTAHQNLAQFRRESSIRSWLLGIARNKCLQHIEKSRRRGAHLWLVKAEEQEAPMPEDTRALRQRAERARALLDRVKPSDREALILRYTAMLSFKDVATACGIAEPAARQRVSRALTRLRGVMKEEDSDA